MSRNLNRSSLPQGASSNGRRARSRAELWFRSAHRVFGLLGAALVLVLSARAPGALHETAADWRAETAVLPAPALHAAALSRGQTDARDARRSAPPFDTPSVVEISTPQPTIIAGAARVSLDRVGPRRTVLARGYEATAPPSFLR